MTTKTDRRKFFRTAGGIGAGLALAGVSFKLGTVSKEKNNWEQFNSIVMNRRSVRKYLKTEISDEHLRKIIDCARMAPTSGNQQPWKFLVVRDPLKIKTMKDRLIQATLERLTNVEGEIDEERKKKALAYYKGILSAPVYVIILTDNESPYPGYNKWDGALAAGNFMLAARALGYGTVFITDAIPDALTKEVFQIPDRYTRVCITPVGVPVEWPATPEKKELDEFII